MDGATRTTLIQLKSDLIWLAERSHSKLSVSWFELNPQGYQYKTDLIYIWKCRK